MIFSFKSNFGGWLNIPPHVADDLGYFGDFGGWVVSLDFVIDLTSIKEEGRESSFGSGWLNKYKVTLSEISFLPIIYNV